MRLLRSRQTLLRAALILALVFVVAAAQSGDAVAQAGKWSGSVGLAVAGDPDEPYTGTTGPEIAIWYVLNERVDVGGRVGTFTFDSDGLTFPEAPFLIPGEGKIVPLELAGRYYPMGSGRTVFPILGASVVVPVSDSFSGERVALPGQLGVFLESDWEVDSVGFGAEAGARWDVSERFFLELTGRYVVLGAESTGTIEVTPVISEPRVVDTSLDGYRLAVHAGIYF